MKKRGNLKTIYFIQSSRSYIVIAVERHSNVLKNEDETGDIRGNKSNKVLALKIDPRSPPDWPSSPNFSHFLPQMLKWPDSHCHATSNRFHGLCDQMKDNLKWKELIDAASFRGQSVFNSLFAVCICIWTKCSLNESAK